MILIGHGIERPRSLVHLDIAARFIEIHKKKQDLMDVQNIYGNYDLHKLNSNHIFYKRSIFMNTRILYAYFFLIVLL